jgi:hypothetical protein
MKDVYKTESFGCQDSDTRLYACRGQVSAFAVFYPLFPATLTYLRRWTSAGLHKLIPGLMVANVLVIVASMMILPRLGLSLAALHRWGPYRFPQFVTGVAAGLLARRPDVAAQLAKANLTLRAEACSVVLSLSSMVVCPVLVHISVVVGGLPTWDLYNTTAEYVVTPVYAYWILALTSPGCRGLTRAIASSRPMKLLGEVSYSLYCTHVPVSSSAPGPCTGGCRSGRCHSSRPRMPQRWVVRCLSSRVQPLGHRPSGASPCGGVLIWCVVRPWAGSACRPGRSCGSCPSAWSWRLRCTTLSRSPCVAASTSALRPAPGTAAPEWTTSSPGGAPAERGLGQGGKAWRWRYRLLLRRLPP